MRRCRDCHELCPGPYCPTHAPLHVRHGTHTATATQRGYDRAWRRTRLTILNRDGHTCQIRTHCNGAHADTVDHITPLSRGGDRLDPANLQAACRACNSAKSGH